MSQPIYQEPEYIRLPKASYRDPITGVLIVERDPHSKLSRSSLDRLVRAQLCNDFKPPVESKVVSIRGGKNASRGARLISLKSLLAYIGSQSELTSVSATEEVVQ